MRVTEIFRSIQGEGTRAGRPSVFIRFTGCDLRCRYCDTSYAFQGGQDLSRKEILSEIQRYPCRLVLLTGGEPMLQPEIHELTRDLLSSGYEVTIETHGQQPLDRLPPEAIRIADVKTPGSGEVTLDFDYLERLQPHDEVKFVICSEEDFRWSVEVIRRRRLEGRLTILFSPATGLVDPKDLARWLLESGIEARLSLQLHQIIWGADVRGV